MGYEIINTLYHMFRFCSMSLIYSIFINTSSLTLDILKTNLSKQTFFDFIMYLFNITHFLISFAWHNIFENSIFFPVINTCTSIFKKNCLIKSKINIQRFLLLNNNQLWIQTEGRVWICHVHDECLSTVQVL